MDEINLVGGYYDAGGNVKYSFPMAYAMTMLAWSVVEFETQLAAKNELENALAAIKWGTDFLIKAHPVPNVLFALVGEGDSDNDCWQRPEDLYIPKVSHNIDDAHPGSDLAAETAAALAASSIAFESHDPRYSALLVIHATELFEFAKDHPGLYSESIPAAKKFYNSTDQQDELLWAASWLYRATNYDDFYLQYIDAYQGTGGPRTMFSWDDKWVGVQIFIAKMVLEGKLPIENQKWADYKSFGDGFLCYCIRKGGGDYNVKRSPGGLNWWSPWNNLQYTTSAAFIATVYSEYLAKLSTYMECPWTGGSIVEPGDLIDFARSQVDYILGSNPSGMSFMVGFGSNYPKQIHHRGASIVSIKTDNTSVTCKGGYETWYNRNAPDPNVLEGAIVGGPDENDSYVDARSNVQQAEPALVNVAPLVGVLARLA